MNIRNIKAVCFAVLLCLSMGIFSGQSYAQVSIAVVDVERVLAESDAAQSVQKQIDTKRKAFLAMVKKTEEKLRSDQKAIEAKRSELSKEELLKKAQNFDRKRIEARSSIQSKKAKLDKSYSEAMNILTKAIFEVCQKIADEDKIDLVITRQNIIVGSNSLDITAKVMERMNKTLPELNLK